MVLFLAYFGERVIKPHITLPILLLYRTKSMQHTLCSPVTMKHVISLVDRGYTPEVDGRGSHNPSLGYASCAVPNSESHNESTFS